MTKERPKHRRWIPVTRSPIKEWTWSKEHGLRVHFVDGATPRRSDWKTLKAFLKAVKEGREHAHEVPWQ